MVFYVGRRRYSFMKDSLNASGAGILFFDSREKLRFVNDEAKAFLPILVRENSISLESVLNYLFDHAEDVDDDLRDAMSYLAEEHEGDHFREIIRSDSGVLTLAVVKKNQQKQTVVTLTDLSLMEAQYEQVFVLHKVNRDLVQAIESTTCAVLLTDPKRDPHSVVFVNDACCRVLKMQRDDVVGIGVDQLLQRIGIHGAQNEIKQALRDVEPCQTEIKFAIDGALRWYDLRITPVLDENGTLDLFIAVFTDMTALKLKESEFFKAQKLEALGQLAAGVAHDFNNLLSIIDGYSRMISDAPDEPEKIVQNSEKIQSAAQRGASLTQKMLTFSRHKIVHEAVIDLGETVMQQKTLIDPIISADIMLSMDCEGEHLYAECSSDSIAQIVLNLSINARDAMPNGGALDIFLRQCDADLGQYLPSHMRYQDFLCLGISDTGEGMDQDILDRVFEPFFTTKEQGKGTGLGLSVVYGLVQDMSGHVHVISTPGDGTTFYVFIPRSDKEPEKRIAGVFEDVDSIELKGYTVLVVEDEEDIRNLVVHVLEERGMTVLNAGDGNEALAVAEMYDGDVDILVTDIVMPGLNGVKLAELLQAVRPSVQVIFMSGYPARGDGAHVDLPEDTLFVPKPLDYDLLCRLIFMCLSPEIEGSSEVLLKTASKRWDKVQEERCVE